MRYPIGLNYEDGIYVVESRDLYGLNTYGDTVEEALRHAGLGVGLILQDCMDRDLPLPPPGERAPGEYWVELTPVQTAKIGLYHAMKARGTGRRDLAVKLRADASQVDRLLDITRRSRLEKVVEALAVLGYRVRVRVEPSDLARAA